MMGCLLLKMQMDISLIANLLNEGLRTTIDKNLTNTDKKAPNNSSLYVNAYSNYPTTILN